MKIKLLYPSDFFDIKSVDADYEEEYEIASKFPEFEVILYNYEEFVSSGNLKCYPNNLDEGICIYRGWMLKPDKYKELYERLKIKGISLINDADKYNNCHLFPSTYDNIKGYTPKTKWYEDYKEIDWNDINIEFERFMIKDYVKSVKGSKFPRYFETPVRKDVMDSYIEEFINLRGALFTEGIVIKEFVDFKKYGERTNEYRAFYLNGKLVTVSKNSSQPDKCPVVPIEFVEKFNCLDSNFYTVDFAELENGDWIVVETGDGQVSGLSPNQYIFKFYDEIRAIIKESK
ncbi:ATP-grasp domain-containing protein [Clostridium sp. SHJSY1]|uniref:ATP-grasp domain-containing protein n=1 Tax=Clostridium sp. SHJSY1 TaxID=2942483 RepID=UPI0028760C65|nr:ATP-grasp domain-containing protein [Clostridium sp. SHJSY1]MDS0526599.1 ATP-grasp domain-containing protein [Clostridium sp. SHJSY1]